MGFSFQHLGPSPGVGTWGAGVPRGSKKIEHGHVLYQIDGKNRQNRMQVKVYPRFKRLSLGEVKRSNIIKLQLQVSFKDFLYETLCVFSQMKDIKHI